MHSGLLCQPCARLATEGGCAMHAVVLLLPANLAAQQAGTGAAPCGHMRVRKWQHKLRCAACPALH